MSSNSSFLSTFIWACAFHFSLEVVQKAQKEFPDKELDQFVMLYEFKSRRTFFEVWRV